MPISTPFPLRAIEQKEFVVIDYEVMRHAFASQNELGRLCDEVIYQNDLAARLSAVGLSVRTEVPVTVYHQDFSKTYFLDLVVNDSAIYELKTVTQLVREHEAQLLNYLYLEGVHHGKLINFRPPKVESWFGNTKLTHKLRRQCRLNAERWREPSEASRRLRSILVGAA
jgi:GxxExxY protein